MSVIRLLHLRLLLRLKTYDFVGGKGNLWTILKSFLSANNYQITWVYDTIVLFENHTVLTRFQGSTVDYSIQWAIGEPFSHIECTYYPLSLT